VSVALFIRHGKASAMSGDYDRLSPPGVEQSERLGEWLAEQRLVVSAVFLGPRKRHAQTHEAVTRVLSARGLALPEPTVLQDLDEHQGISLVFKLLPSLASEDETLRAVVESTGRGESPSPDDMLVAFKRITRRWVRGEIGHDEVESWASFRERIARAMARIAELGRGKTALAESLGVRNEEKVMELSWSLYNGSITELDFTGDRWGVRTFNATPHLRDKRLVTSV
jgi:broad specificity phosphatase PhoE